jgi:DNA-binding CsgD family transcriptional regulator
LIAAARGDVATALSTIEDAIEAHDGLEMPLELGRTWLVAAQLQRRAGRRRLASASLDRAGAIFESVGATAWTERVRGERTRLGLHPTDGAGLTPSEERIAGMAAAGLTNREVARRLSISPKTVEANLARVYLKLGIHSRAELGAAAARLGAEGDPARDGGPT